MYWELTQSPTFSVSPPVSGCGQHSPPPHSHLKRCSSSFVVGEVERTAGNQFTQLQFNCRSFCRCLPAPVTHPLLRDCSSSPPPLHLHLVFPHHKQFSCGCKLTGMEFSSHLSFQSHLATWRTQPRLTNSPIPHVGNEFSGSGARNRESW